MEEGYFCKIRGVCRTCGTTNGKFASIYGKDIINTLEMCYSLDIKFDDDLPDKICKKCLIVVMQTSDFKKKCMLMDQELRKHLFTKEDDGKNDLFDINPNIYICPYCKQKYKESKDLIKHLDDKHYVRKTHSESHISGVKPSSDDECASDYNNTENVNEEDRGTEDLTSFLKDNLISRPLSCNDCSQTFNLEHDLKLHESTHMKTDYFVCSSCNKRFQNRQMFMRHIKIHMIDKPHFCSVCKKGFAEAYALTKHMRTHNGNVREKRHSCNICHKKFSELFYLNVHMRKHTGERPFICDTCGKTFYDPRSMKIHMIMHSGEKKYKCNYCDKFFTQKVNLTKHIRIHTGEKPYICSTCGKQFNQSSSLVKHMKLHSCDKPYNCTVCSKRFVDETIWMRHVKTHSTGKTLDLQE